MPCVVLNAKNDDEEAAIIAEAGAYGAVTVSTQMAGRGVDIRLGGSDQADRDRVAELGGLYVIGSGQHDSRRVDDQLRGRAGRQGDPGGSVFFVSLEDELVVRNAGDEIPPSPQMTADGLVTDEQVDCAVEHAQRVAEGVNHEIHRNTWRYSVVDRAAAQGAGRAARAAADHRRRRRDAAGAVPGEGRGDGRGAARQGRPGRSRCTTSTGSGPSTWPSCPRSARACTCARWAGSTRSTSSTAPPCRRSTS